MVKRAFLKVRLPISVITDADVVIINGQLPIMYEELSVLNEWKLLKFLFQLWLLFLASPLQFPLNFELVLQVQLHIPASLLDTLFGLLLGVEVLGMGEGVIG